MTDVTKVSNSCTKVVLNTDDNYNNKSTVFSSDPDLIVRWLKSVNARKCMPANAPAANARIVSLGLVRRTVRTLSSANL